MAKKSSFQRFLAVVSTALFALAPALPAPGALLPYREGVLGALQHYRVKRNESLFEIARRFDLGLNEMAAANPGVDPFVPTAGGVVTVPTAWILPSAPHHATLVINLPEYRLYYFPRSLSGKVLTYPLGIGDEGRATPTGRFKVVEKIVHPVWHVPESIRRTQPQLPKVMPAGPDNPMGSHALRLSGKGILIHGTDRPWGIGRRSSHGCLRLYPEDIVKLFAVVPKGAEVVILDQPVKVGTRGNKVYLEAHKKDRTEVTAGEVIKSLADSKLLSRVDFAKVISTLEERRGVPVDISLDFLDAASLPESKPAGAPHHAAARLRSPAVP